MSNGVTEHNLSESGSAPAMKTLVLERIDCPLCGCDNADVLLHTADNLCHVPGWFAIDRCRQCRHIFMNPRPASDSMSLCYPLHYGPHQTTPEQQRAGVSLSPQAVAESTAKLVPWYLRFLPLRHAPGLRRFYYWLMDDKSHPLPDFMRSESIDLSVGASHSTDQEHARPKALELGCATGRYLQRLMENGWSVVGVEPGERAAALARAVGLNVYCGTLATCQLAPQSFDAAAAWMVIEHVPDPRDTLTRLAQLLKPRGKLLLSVPNAGCWEPFVFGRFWYAWEPPRHLHHFTPASIRRLLSESGFIEITITHQRTLLNVVGSLGLVILSRWPGSRLGKSLISCPDHPNLPVQLLLAPLAHLMAFLRQGGRLTITARRDGRHSASGGCQPSEGYSE